MTGADWILAHGDTMQVAVYFSLPLALAGLERWIPRRPGPMDRTVRWPANFLLTFLNLLALSVLPVSLLAAAFWADSTGWGLLNQVSLPLVATVTITLLVRGFISFFSHYLMHQVPFLWQIHRVHHLDTELDVSTTVRFHPLEFVAQALPGLPIVVAFGLTPWVLVCYELLDVAVTLWSHSNIRVPAALDRVLHYAIVTPDLHRIHHSAWRTETNSNRGAVFPIWDLMFGTFRPTARDGHERMRLGLDEVRGPAAHRALWLLGSPFHSRLDASLPAPHEHDDGAGDRGGRRKECVGEVR
jgi:sterol desaturase/sphingolipid hydroxylase (fatty acid hydroxylase superfamily)